MHQTLTSQNRWPQAKSLMHPLPCRNALCSSQRRGVLLSSEHDLQEIQHHPRASPLQSAARMFATGLGHGADLQQLHTGSMSPPPAPPVQPCHWQEPLSKPSTGRLLASHPCKTQLMRNALDFLDMPRSPPQSLLSRYGTFPVPRSTKEPLCACSVATSPASPGIWQAAPLTTLLEIPVKQAGSQIPLTVSGRKHVWGKIRCVVDPQTRPFNERTLVLPREVCTMENASQVTRK